MDHQVTWNKLAEGSPVWLSDPDHAYVEGKLLEVDDTGTRLTVEADGNQRIHVDTTLVGKAPKTRRRGAAPVRKVVPRAVEGSHVTVENMDDLSPLNAACILANVEYRFRLDSIYTRTGPILIAMNPFKWLPIYGEDTIKRYRGREYGSLPPHPYQEAEEAFQKIGIESTAGCNNQAVVICGESGAGKTETTKLMLQYLATIARRSTADETAELGGKLVGSNPLMEAFGNAKTLRNNNSSRFGKFTKLLYDKRRIICGGEISSFLLEKARVVSPPEGERNYHVFYQLLVGADSDTREDLLLESVESYRCLSVSNCLTVDGLDDQDEYGNTLESMQAVNIDEREQAGIMRVVAGVLHLGNVSFVANADEESCRVGDTASLSRAASMLEVSASELGDALIKRVRRLPSGQEVVSPQTVEQACASRDALAKAIYAALFDWIVRRINSTLSVTAERSDKFIGILDIFGFEEMPTNGFEQLLINFTNEKLQQLFNLAVFQEEAEEYEREQIQWDRTEFPDNNPCIELVEKKPMGLIPFMESECSRGAAASDRNLVGKWHKTYASHPFYGVCGPSTQYKHADGSWTDAQEFVIKHYAGPVIYRCEAFIRKNLDALFPHLASVCSASSGTLMRTLFPVQDADDHRAGRATVAGGYLAQLTELVATLRASDIRFVRCIKTNDDFAPQVVDRPSVLRQLVCSGVMAALAIRRSGYPTRVPYVDFVRDFRVFGAFCERTAQPSKPRELTHRMMTCGEVAEKVAPEDYRFGQSKLFLRADVLLTLQQMKNRLILPFVLKIQHWWIRNQEDILSHRLKRAIQLLGDTIADAAACGVKGEPSVRRAMEESVSAVRYARGLTINDTNAYRSALQTASDRLAHFAKAVREAKARRDEEAKQRAELLRLVDQGRTRLGAVREGMTHLGDEFGSEYLSSAFASASSAIADCRTVLVLHANRTAVASQSDLPSSFASSALQRTFTKVVIELERQSSALSNGDDDTDLDLEGRRRQVQDALDLVDAAVRVFEDAESRMIQVEDARGAFGAALRRLLQELDRLAADAEAQGVADAPSFAAAHQRARAAAAAAEASLLGTEVAAYEASVQAAEEACAACARELEGAAERKAEADERAQLAQDLQAERERLDALVAAAEAYGVASAAAVQDALLHCDEAFRAAALETAGGDLAGLGDAVRRAARQVGAFDFVLQRERRRKEDNDALRAAELLRLDGAEELLSELALKASADGLADHDGLSAASDAAHRACEAARLALERSEDVEADAAPVDAALEAAQACERAFIGARQERDALRRDAQLVGKRLRASEERLQELKSEAEACGPVAMELLEEQLDQADAELREARRIVAKASGAGLPLGDCLPAAQRADAALDALRESLDEVRRVLKQTARARDREDATLAEAEAELQRLRAAASAGEQDRELREALQAAGAECQQARGRLQRPLSAAWMYADELAGDIAAVAAAVQAVYAAETALRDFERGAAVLRRHRRLNGAQLALEADKLEALEAFCSDLGLSALPGVQQSLEDANEALDAARRACGMPPGPSADAPDAEDPSAGAPRPDGVDLRREADQQAAQAAVQRCAAAVASAEKECAAAKFSRDATNKMRAAAAAQLDQLDARLRGLAAANRASGPCAEALCLSEAEAAAEALAAALRQLRRGADAAQKLLPAVALAEGAVAAAEAKAERVRKQAARAARDKHRAALALRSLQETHDLALEKAAASRAPPPDDAPPPAAEGDAPAAAAAAAPAPLPQEVSAAADKAAQALRAAAERCALPLERWIAEGAAGGAALAAATGAVQAFEESVDLHASRAEALARRRRQQREALERLRLRHHAVLDGAGALSSTRGAGDLEALLLSCEEALLELRQLPEASGPKAFARCLAQAEERLARCEAKLRAEDLADQRLRAERAEAEAALPVLRQRLSELDACVASSHAALAELCAPAVAAAKRRAAEVERAAGGGGGSAAGGLCDAAFRAVGAAEQSVGDASRRLAKALSQRDGDRQRVELLGGRLRQCGERLGALCAWSDALRVALEAEWGDACWFGSQSRFTNGGGGESAGGGGLKELRPSSAVALLRDALRAAEGALGKARRLCDAPVREWLGRGALLGRRGVEDAVLKVAALEEVIDGEALKLERAEAQRRAAKELLEAQADRLAGAKAVAEAAGIDCAASAHVSSAVGAADAAIDAVAELVDAGAAAAARAPMDEACRAVATACEAVSAEVDRRERRRAEASAALDELRRLSHALFELEAQRAQLLEGGDAEPDGASDVDALRLAAERLIGSAKRLAEGADGADAAPARVARALFAAHAGVEACERGLRRLRARRAELLRLQQRRELAERMRAARAAEAAALEAQAEQRRRLRLRGVLAGAAGRLAGKGPVVAALAAQLRAGEAALSAAGERLDGGGSVAAAGSAVRGAILELQGLDLTAAALAQSPAAPMAAADLFGAEVGADSALAFEERVAELAAQVGVGMEDVRFEVQQPPDAADDAERSPSATGSGNAWSIIGEEPRDAQQGKAEDIPEAAQRAAGEATAAAAADAAAVEAASG